MQSASSIIAELIADLTHRQKEVLNKRFCLDGRAKESVTLAELGKRYGITRERVRQIENAAFAAVRKKISGGTGKDLFLFIRNYFTGVAGVCRHDKLAGELPPICGALTPIQLGFLLEADNGYAFHPEDKNFYDFWHCGEKSFQLAASIIDKTRRYFLSNKDEILTKKNFQEILSAVAENHRISDMLGAHILSISKKFGVNQYGDFGLSEWPEINPRTVRDRAYLVLKNLGKPAHFREIAALIKQREFDDKKVHASTVHNELIKDKRFVLVGRGIYALAERGYQPGTAQEVIRRILKTKGPLPAKDLVRAVLAERMFKENTVLLNLQNKRFFRRLADGRYHVNEA